MRTALVMGLCGLMVLSVRRAHADDDNDLRPDVLACEEAVKKLSDCCDGFEPKYVTCTYFVHEDDGCDYTTTTTETPSYLESESACIIGLDCATLRATGVCTRAQAAVASVSSTCSSADMEDFCPSPDGSETSTDRPAVCP